MYQCSVCQGDSESGPDGALSCIYWNNNTLQPICAECRDERIEELATETQPKEWLRTQFRYRARIVIEDTDTPATGDGHRADRTYEAPRAAPAPPPRKTTRASGKRGVYQSISADGSTLTLTLQDGTKQQHDTATGPLQTSFGTVSAHNGRQFISWK